MQLEMLQEDLFDTESQDSQQPSSSHSATSLDKSSDLYKKLDLEVLQEGSRIALVSDEHAEEESENLFTQAPLMGREQAVNVPQLPVLEAAESIQDMQDDLYSDSHHSPELDEEPADELQAADLEEDIIEDVEVADGPVAAAVEKAPGAFKTISEAAGLLGVPQHVLRFWESRFSQIKPLKMRGGRRYYRPEDMEILSTVKHLLYKQGYTIKGAKKVFSTRNREALDAAHRETMAVQTAPAPKKMAERIVEKSVFIEKPVVVEKPVFDERKKKQLANIRNELLGLRETLSAYLN